MSRASIIAQSLSELAELTRGRGAAALVFGDGVHHLNQPTVKGGWWVQAIARAQAADPTFPIPTIHDRRHTATSLAVSAGANVKAVQRMLGHASAAMTLDVYADLFDEDIESVSTALDQARLRPVSAHLLQYLWSFCGRQRVLRISKGPETAYFRGSRAILSVPPQGLEP